MKRMTAFQLGSCIGKSNKGMEIAVEKIWQNRSSPRPQQGEHNSRNESNVSDKEIEQEIIAKGKIAPRVTPDRIEHIIAKEEYHRLTPVLTVCVLTLANGFTVTGESACASPENFDEEIGNKIARENAKQKIWTLEGYLLKQRLLTGGVNLRTPHEIARVCHEVNRAYCQALGDNIHGEGPVSGLTFGLAIEALKLGKKVARAGWNGKGMWLTLSCSSSKIVKAEDIWAPHNREFAIANGGEVQVDPYITMKTAQNTIQSGWLASQADMLAEDWQVVA